MKLTLICDSEYDDLEDADQFEGFFHCPGCDYDFQYSTRYAAPCFYCGETACQEDDPRMLECGGTVIDPKTKEAVWTCRNCRKRLMIESEYDDLEDQDQFESDEPVNYRTVYRKSISGTRVEILLFVDANNPQRWEIGWTQPNFGGWYLLDEDSMLYDIATWVGLDWRQGDPNILENTKDHIYKWFYKVKDKWRFPPEWGRLWDPPPGYPPKEPPNWAY